MMDGFSTAGIEVGGTVLHAAAGTLVAAAGTLEAAAGTLVAVSLSH